MFTPAGPIPMGYRYLAMSTSDNTHKIPIEKKKGSLEKDEKQPLEFESDYRRILAELEEFVSPGTRRELPPVFAKVCSSYFMFLQIYIFRYTSPTSTYQL